MKKYVRNIISLVFVLLFTASCAAKPHESPTAQASQSQAEQPVGSTTLMIYMVGSDLEAKSGAGTSDLEEILASGVNTENNNVLVYAGGSPKWHNEYQEEQKNTLLHLTADGFEKADAFEQNNMCEAETLSSFLNYSVENYPADGYALILWDHGSGPLIGYGADMLHSNDTLTLTEMQTALASSPFSAENKLKWVGFDACLMASAELACIWSDYAEYMVASQEVEPVFGWEYAFLKDLGLKPHKELLGDITEQYLTACVEYFEHKKFKDSISSLSCVDLSHTAELKSAINNLFAAASADVATLYDDLVASRIEAHSVGKASTGSDYDLVDLHSLCTGMSKKYPEQAAALAGVIDKMVIKNATNSEGLSGLSFYYPFYNKFCYQDGWSGTYRNMNVFESYTAYLAEYEKIWLGSDMFDNFASSSTPEESSGNKYSVKLTKRQAKHFASAKYYILQKQGEDVYNWVYVSSDTELKDGELTAAFDGNVIYANSDTGDSFIPVTVEHDTVGNTAHYSVSVNINNSTTGNVPLKQDDFAEVYARFLLAADKSNKTIDIVNLSPYATEAEDDLEGGKKEEIDLDEYYRYIFFESDTLTVVRNRKGVVLPIEEWKTKGLTVTHTYLISNGLSFEYAPLASKNGEEYALIFEITDTQGHSYCSEPIDIEEAYWEKADSAKPSAVNSNGKFPLLIKEDENFALHLDTKNVNGKNMLTVNATNKSSEAVKYSVNLTTCNNNLTIDSIVSGELQGGESKIADYEFDFGTPASTGLLQTLTSLNLSVDVTKKASGKILWNGERFDVNFSSPPNISLTAKKGVALNSSYSYKDTVIPRQIIADDSAKTVELIYLNENEKLGRLDGILRIRNKSSEEMFFVLDGISFDGITCYAGLMPRFYKNVKPGTDTYVDFRFEENNLGAESFAGMQKLDMIFRYASSSDSIIRGYGSYDVCNVRLTKQSAKPFELTQRTSRLAKENGVIFSLIEYNNTDSYSNPYWLLIVENTNDYGIHFEETNVSANGGTVSFSSGGGNKKIAPKQSRIVRLSHSEGVTGKVEFNVDIYDYTGQKLLLSGKKDITVKTK